MRPAPSSTTSRSSAAPTSRCAPSRSTPGTKLWSHPMKGAVSGGVAITREDVFAVAGIREPGLDKRSRSSGVYRFSLHGKRAQIHIRRRPTSSPRRSRIPPSPQPCVGSPCTLGFELKKPPAGLDAVRSARDHRTTLPRPGARGGARPAGGLAAPRDAGGDGRRDRLRRVPVRERRQPDRRSRLRARRRASTAPERTSRRRGATYNRVSIVAVKDRTRIPTLADGFERLVTTQSFDPPLQPAREKVRHDAPHARHSDHGRPIADRHRRRARRAGRLGAAFGAAIAMGRRRREAARHRVQRRGQQPQRVRQRAAVPAATRHHHPRRRPQGPRHQRADLLLPRRQARRHEVVHRG